MIFFVCKKCGSSMAWNEKEKRLKCTVCDSSVFNTIKSSVCPECKAKIKVSKNVLSGHCPKCHTPFITDEPTFKNITSNNRGRYATQNKNTCQLNLKMIPAYISADEAARRINKKIEQYAYSDINKNIKTKNIRLFYVPISIHKDQNVFRLTLEGRRYNDLLTKKDTNLLISTAKSIPFDQRRLLGSDCIWQTSQAAETCFIPIYSGRIKKKEIIINGYTGYINTKFTNNKRKEQTTFYLWNFLSLFSLLFLWILIR